MVHEEGKSGRGCRQDGVALRSEKDDMERLRYLAGRTPTRPALPPALPPARPLCCTVGLCRTPHVACRTLHDACCTLQKRGASHTTQRPAQTNTTAALPASAAANDGLSVSDGRGADGDRSVWHKRDRVRTLYKRDRSVWHKRDRVRTLSDLASSRGRTRWCIRSICGSRTQ
jgi:hypothetical protein